MAAERGVRRAQTPGRDGTGHVGGYFLIWADLDGGDAILVVAVAVVVVDPAGDLDRGVVVDVVDVVVVVVVVVFVTLCCMSMPVMDTPAMLAVSLARRVWAPRRLGGLRGPVGVLAAAEEVARLARLLVDGWALKVEAEPARCGWT